MLNNIKINNTTFVELFYQQYFADSLIPGNYTFFINKLKLPFDKVLYVFYDLSILKIQYVEASHSWEKYKNMGYCVTWCILYIYNRCVKYGELDILNHNNSIILDIIKKKNVNINFDLLNKKANYILLLNNIYYHFVKNIIKKDFILYYSFENINLLKKFVHYYESNIQKRFYKFLNENSIKNIKNACEQFKNLPQVNLCYNILDNLFNLEYEDNLLNKSINKDIDYSYSLNLPFFDEKYKIYIDAFNAIKPLKTEDLKISNKFLTFKEFENKIKMEYIPKFANRSVNDEIFKKSIFNIKKSLPEKKYIIMQDIYKELAKETYKTGKKFKSNYKPRKLRLKPRKKLRSNTKRSLY